MQLSVTQVDVNYPYRVCGATNGHRTTAWIMTHHATRLAGWVPRPHPTCALEPGRLPIQVLLRPLSSASSGPPLLPYLQIPPANRENKPPISVGADRSRRPLLLLSGRGSVQTSERSAMAFSKRKGSCGGEKKDLFHVVHKVPAGDSPYVRAKHLQVDVLPALANSQSG
jgi:hypothetical protein